MKNNERHRLIIAHGQDICDYCQQRFPYTDCNAATCRSAEDQFRAEIVKHLP